MERNMTKFCIDESKPRTCSASPNHDLIPLEIQRWEDDGGAILTDISPCRQRAGEHRHELVGELAAAE
jgi:hypothetical protein